MLEGGLDGIASIGSGIDIDGVRAGNAQDAEGGTGCTVVLCEKGAVGAVDVRGGGPATRETDLLRPENSVEAVNAIMLSGGSAFGLDAAGGAMKYLEELGCGFPTGVLDVPIVCGASIFDLGVGDPHVRPDASMGYAACKAAGSISELGEGNVGAGTGATVGKLLGGEGMMKSGLGVAGVQVGGLKVDAIASVNAAGTVVDPDGRAIAGVLASDGSGVVPARGAELQMLAGMQMAQAGGGFDGMAGEGAGGSPVENTTVCCVVTNAAISKAHACKAASMCHDGYARAIEPVHTSMDGDTVFVLATGEVPATMDMVGVLGAIVCEEAIRRAVLAAEPAYGLRSARSLR